MAKDTKDGSDSDFSVSEEGAASDGSARAASDTASFETDSELSDDPLGEYDDADSDSYEQRRHKYTRGAPPCVLCMLKQSLSLLHAPISDDQ